MLHVFLLIVFVFVLVAVACAFASFSRSPTVRRTATRAIYGSLVAALISAALAAWFFHGEKTTPAPMRLGIADKSSGAVLPMSTPEAHFAIMVIGILYCSS
jgi:hypothetical protein